MNRPEIIIQLLLIVKKIMYLFFLGGLFAVWN